MFKTICGRYFSFLLIFNKANIFSTSSSNDLAIVSNSVFQWDVSVQSDPIKQAQKIFLCEIQQTRYNYYVLFFYDLTKQILLKNI